jgi:hypothetical protein
MTSSNSMILTTGAIAASVLGLVLTAALKSGTPALAYAHLAISLASAGAFAVVAIREMSRLIATNATPSELAASNAGHLGLVWCWGALAIAVTYGTQVLSWREWWQFLLAFVLAAALCLFFSATLKKDAAVGKVDDTLLGIARVLSIVQLVGMAAVVIGLLVDGKMTRFRIPRFTDWAANNIFFAGAIAVAAISGYALKTIPKPVAKTGA